MLKLTNIYIYPIKSLGGIEVTESKAQERGLQYDRRWMLVDSSGVFMSQRKVSKMALLQTAIVDEMLHVHAPDGSLLEIPLSGSYDKVMEVSVWDDTCAGYEVGEAYNQWFSDQLGTDCRLIYMGEQERFANPASVRNKETVSFADGYQYLIAGQSSLDDLNTKLDDPVPMNRFRPNLVFSGGTPFEEDDWGDFNIGDVEFYAIKPCARCIVVTIDQQTGLKTREPLTTMAKFRKRDNKIYFGLNACVVGDGVIRVGDAVILSNN
jgi:uncharacterized protein YcbX